MVSPYLTDVQRKEWEKEGFLIIKNVLSSAEMVGQVEKLTNARKCSDLPQS